MVLPQMIPGNAPGAQASASANDRIEVLAMLAESGLAFGSGLEVLLDRLTGGRAAR